MQKTTRALLIAGLFTAASPGVALAADPPADAKPDAAKPAIPTLGDVLGASGITATGYVDIGWEHLSGTGIFQTETTSPMGLIPLGPDRVFDYEHHSFNVHQAAITIAKQPTDGFGALVNLTAGKDSNTIHSYDMNTSNFDITQGFIQYVKGPLTVMGGKFVTLAGAETINPTTDTNYSRSILFGYAIPFTHTGLRATYAVSDMFSVIAGINNGWDQLKDSNTQKTAELGVSLTPSKMVALTVQGYSGTEQSDGFTSTAAQGTRNLIDAVLTLNLTDALSIIVNPDWGSQDNALDISSTTALVNGSRKKAEWYGVAGYVNYSLSEQWRVSVRGEYFDDKDGYRTGVIQKWKEATLTLAYMPTKSVELRAEVRGDKSDHYSFGQTNGSGSKTQSSIGLEGIYKF